MELGPPCTCTTMGYFFAGSKLRGYNSQPCKLKLSFVQWMLFASPHAALRVALLEVICFQLPIGPAQISGGWLKDCRMTAAILPSEVMEPAEPWLMALIESGLFHSVSTAPLFTSIEAMPQPPSIHSPNSSFCPFAGH